MTMDEDILGAVAVSGEQNPDEVAESERLANLGGTTAEVVQLYGNKDFAARLRGASGAAIVRDNEWLSSYLRQERLAIALLNDSYGGLDRAIRTVATGDPDGDLVESRSLWGFLKDVGTSTMSFRPWTDPGFMKGFGDQPLTGGWKKPRLDPQGKPLLDLTKDQSYGPRYLYDPDPEAYHEAITAQRGPSLWAMSMLSGMGELGMRVMAGTISALGYSVAGDQGAEFVTGVLGDPGLQATLGPLGVPFGALAPSATASLAARGAALAKGVKGAGLAVEAAEGVSRLTSAFILSHAKDPVQDALEAKVRRERRFLSPETTSREMTDLTRTEAQLTEFRRAKLYFDEKSLPPALAVPSFDLGLGVRNAEAIDKMAKVIEEIQQTPAIERTPERLATIMNGVHENQDMLISVDAFKKLGDKVSEALGWISDLDRKLEVAKLGEGYVHVGVGEWITNAALRQGLHDSIREHLKVLHDAPTVAEAAEIAARPPKDVIIDPVAIAKDAAGLEPMASFGSRKFTLQRVGGDPGFHNFVMVDAEGHTVGTVFLSEQKGGKRLWVDWMGGVNGMGARDFGPSAMFEFHRQLKGLFPKAEAWGGHRVSGMREKWGTVGKKSAEVWFDFKNALETPETYRSMQESLQGGHWESWSENSRAWMMPKHEMAPELHLLAGVVRKELERIIPQNVRIRFASRLALGEDAVGGAYLRFKAMLPIVAVALEEGRPMWAALHEALHHLREYGFISDAEWAMLQRTAEREGWIKKYRIKERYGSSSYEQQLHEAIADHFATWRTERMGAPEVQGVFGKIQQFFDWIKEKVNTALGREVKWDDLFEKIESGEVGAREPGAPVHPLAFDPMANLLPDFTQSPGQFFKTARAVGLTVTDLKRYRKYLEEQFGREAKALGARVLKRVTAEKSKEWNDNWVKMEREETANLNYRPDVAAANAIEYGDFYGKKMSEGNFKLDYDRLTKEQREILDSRTYKRDGADPDFLCKFFGYASGKEMIEHYVDIVRQRKAEGLSHADWVKKTIQENTQRRMEAEYGILGLNIIQDAKDAILGEHGFSILAEETYAMGMKYGQAPLTVDQMKQHVFDLVKKTPLKELSSDQYLAQAGKASERQKSAMLAGDFAEAFRLQQSRTFALGMAGHALQIEKEAAALRRTARLFGKRELEAVDLDFTAHTQGLLERFGLYRDRIPGDLAKRLADSGHADLQGFVAQQATNGRSISIDPRFLDPAFRKPLETLTAEEFRGLKSSVDALNAAGRAEQRLFIRGEQAQRGAVKEGLLRILEGFQDLTFALDKQTSKLPQPVAKLARSGVTMLLQAESFLNRLDKGAEFGLFGQAILRGIKEGDNNAFVMAEGIAKRMRALEQQYGKTANEIIPNNVIMSINGVPETITRGHLRVILSNWGNESNIAKFLQGRKLDRAKVETWLFQNATKADILYAEEVGKIFSDLADASDAMRRRHGWTPMVRVPLQEKLMGYTEDGAFKTHQTKGWYYPVLYDDLDMAEHAGGRLFSDEHISSSTADYYATERTRYSGRIDLSLDRLESRLRSEIWDINLRGAVVDASKLLHDREIRAKIQLKFGTEYVNLLDDWLYAVANGGNTNRQMMKSAMDFRRLSEGLRRNVISTLIAFNPNTVIKHFSTAWYQSMHEGSPSGFIREFLNLTTRDTATGERNWDFAYRNSAELRRRHSDYLDKIGGVTQRMMGEGKWGTFRDAVQFYGSYPVAFSDALSAVPLWLDRYHRGMAEGLSHADAVYAADRAVRRAHGSTALTSRSAAQRGGPLMQWFTSVYGFFNHMANRQYEMAWLAADMRGMPGPQFKAQTGKLIANMFAYVIVPALIEQAVEQFNAKERDSFVGGFGKAAAHTLSGSAPFLRDAVNGYMHGRAVESGGLLGAWWKPSLDLYRDLTKDKMWAAKNRGKLIQDSTYLLGNITGVAPGTVGKAARKVHDYAYGVDR